MSDGAIGSGFGSRGFPTSPATPDPASMAAVTAVGIAGAMSNP